MSVIVKGMEMPKDCRECRMMEYHERTGKTWCKPADGLLADTYRPIMYDGRPDWCPLVEIPSCDSCKYLDYSEYSYPCYGCQNNDRWVYRNDEEEGAENNQCHQRNEKEASSCIARLQTGNGLNSSTSR